MTMKDEKQQDKEMKIGKLEDITVEELQEAVENTLNNLDEDKDIQLNVIC